MLAGAAGGVAFAFDAEARPSGRLSFYNWDTYIGDTTIADFQRATGVRVEQQFYASNAELVAQLRAGNPGFDLVVPSSEALMQLRTEERLLPLNHAQIPNRVNLAPEFQDLPHDPGLRYSMPYTLLAYGIAYSKSRVRETPTWRDVFDSDRYARRISLPGESADLARLCAKYLGHSVNGISAPLLADIERMLIRQKPNLQSFHSDDGQDLLAADVVDLVVEYNGDIAYLQRDGFDDIGFVIPDAGTLMLCDSLAIPTGARNVEAAHAFINFLLSADGGRGVSETILYPTPNLAARNLMPAAYRDSATLFPPAEVLARCEYPLWEGEAQERRFEDMFMRVAASRDGRL